MAQSDQNRPDRDPRNSLSTVVIVMVGQIGCVALVIVLLSVLGGLWLDRTFGTRPLFTLVLLLAGVPLSVFLMVYIGRRTVARINSQAEPKKDELSV